MDPSPAVFIVRSTLGVGSYSFLLQQAQSAESTRAVKADIAKDIGRTHMVRGHPDLEQALANVLLVFAHEHATVGYCQGMNFIVGTLLVVLKNEAKAYTALEGLVKKLGLENLFRPGVPDLHRREFEFNHCIKTSLPDVHAHFKRIGVTTGIFVDKWCMGLFTSYLPVATLLRVWDVCLYDGWKALMRIGVAALKELRPQLLAMDLEALSAYLRDHTRDLHHDAISLLESAKAVKVTRSALSRLADDFLVEQAEHKLEFTNRYPDLSETERKAIETAQCEMEKFSPLMKQQVQEYQIDVETLEKEMDRCESHRLRIEVEAAAKEMQGVEMAIERMSLLKGEKIEELRKCETLIQKSRSEAVYMSIPFVSLLTFQCRSIQPNVSGDPTPQDLDEPNLRGSVQQLNSQLHTLQETHRDKLLVYSTSKQRVKALEARMLSRTQQLTGFIEMWQLKRREVLLKLAHKLRPSLLAK